MEKDNFTQELQTLSPLLAQLRKDAQIPISVPEQYFDNLENKILEKIDNECNIEIDILPTELKSWKPAAPKNYFADLTNRILEKAAQDEKDESSLLPSALKNWQPTAPSGYFDNLADQILEKANPQTTKKAKVAALYTLKISRGAWWVAAASVAVLLAFTWSFWQYNTFDDAPLVTNKNIQNIDNQATIIQQENKIVENLKKNEFEKNTSQPAIETPNTNDITPTMPKMTDLNPTMTTEKTQETWATLVQKDYQNGSNDVEVLNKNLAKILLEANTEGGDLLDLLHFSDEELEAAIGGGK